MSELPINCYIYIIFMCYGKLFFMYKFYNVIKILSEEKRKLQGFGKH